MKEELKKASKISIAYFVEFIIPYTTGDIVKRYTNYGEDVTINGETYKSTLINSDAFNYTDDKSSERKFRFDDVVGDGTELYRIIESRDIKKSVVVNRFYTYSNLFSLGAKLVEDTSKLVRYRKSNRFVEFELKSAGKEQRVGRVQMKNTCAWKFRGRACQYSGDITNKCNLTAKRCKELNNAERFGGFRTLIKR